MLARESECAGYSPAAHGASQPKQRLPIDRRKAELCGLDDGLHCEGRPRPRLAAEPLREAQTVVDEPLVVPIGPACARPRRMGAQGDKDLIGCAARQIPGR